MTSRLPLHGKRILVTRGKDQAKEFSSKIARLGGIPVEIPLLTFQLPENKSEIVDKLSKINTYDWLIFTSTNGVEFFFQELTTSSISIVLPKIAVVGKKTEDTLRKFGYQAEVVPSEFVAEGLIEALRPLISMGDRILLARGNLSRSVLPKELKSLGAYVDDLVMYENVADYKKKAELLELINRNELDVLTFTSPSTVQYFLESVEEIRWGKFIVACIGPITKKKLEDADIPVTICPSSYTIDGMLDELVCFYKELKEES